MASRPLSLLQRGLYWTLALAVGALPPAGAQAQPNAKPKAARSKAAKPKPARPKAKPAAPAEAIDPLTEWELVNGAAIELREKINRQPRNDALRQKMAELAIRSAVGAERALAIGDASLFDSYRGQFRDQFHDTRWRISQMAKQGSGAANYAAGVLALHGFLEPVSVETACRYFGVALGKGYGGARFRASECLEK